jgi:hypothetical protein
LPSPISLPDNPFASNPADLTLPDISKIGVQSLSLRLPDRGFVEHMIVPAIAARAALGAPANNPEPVINAERLHIATAARSILPKYGVTTHTADSVARFVMDFPHPLGTLRCSLNADPPLAFPPDPDPANVASKLTAAHATCTYESS